MIAGAAQRTFSSGGLHRKDGGDTLPRETTSQSASTEPSGSETRKGSGPTDSGKTDNIADSTNQKAERITPFESTARPKSETSRFSDTMAFYEKGSEILELKKDGTFYLDKSLYRAIYKNYARHPQSSGRHSKVQRSESDLLERGRKGETFPNIDSDGVSGQWREDKDAIILATGSGMSLRLVRKSERELIAEGGYRARWLRWEKWEEDWNRLQARRAKVGILRPEDNIAPSKSTAESNVAGPSTFRPRNGKAAPGTMPSFSGVRRT